LQPVSMKRQPLLIMAQQFTTSYAQKTGSAAGNGG